MPTLIGKVAVTDAISLHAQAVPVVAVCFKGNAERGECKVDCPLANCQFLGELNAKCGQRLAYAELQHGLARKLAVTTTGTESPFLIGRADSELVLAVRALDVDGRTSAFFGAVVPVEPFLCRESLPAPFAVDVLGKGGLAGSRAYLETVRYGDVYGEANATDRARLRDLPASPETG